MSALLIARRRLIARFGRPVTLQRQSSLTAFTSVALTGFQVMFRPEQLLAGVQQGDCNLAILDDEIQAAAWPGPPRAQDAAIIDSVTWRVLGAMRVFDGALVIGHTLWIRGGGQ